MSGVPPRVLVLKSRKERIYDFLHKVTVYSLMASTVYLTFETIRAAYYLGVPEEQRPNPPKVGITHMCKDPLTHCLATATCQLHVAVRACH